MTTEARTPALAPRRIDLPSIARAQRRLNELALCYFVLFACFGIALLADVGAMMSQSNAKLAVVIFVLTSWLIWAVAAIQIVRLLRLLGWHRGWAILAGVTSLNSLIGLIFLCWSNFRATVTLRDAGCKVGILGMSNENIRNLVDGACRVCGYDLRGIPTAQCPECGTHAAA
jgi:hypothetical protein